MRYCKNCGAEIDEDSKYCSRCGTLNENSNDDKENNSKINSSNFSYDDEDNDDYYDEDYEEYDEDNHDKRRIKAIIAGLIIFIILGTSGATLYCNYDKLFADDDKNEISLVSIDASKYPNIEVVVKSDSEDKIKNEDLTIKENETFQKDIKVEESSDKGNYKIFYECAEQNGNDNRDIRLSYVKNGKESVIETSYSVTEKNDSKSSDSASGKDKSISAASSKSVNSYDENETLVKNAIDKYETSYIKMVNTKDTYYIKDAIDLGYGLLDEFTKNVASYKEQNITESLESYKVEKIEKAAEDEYDVTVYEKYHIYYGKKHESKNLDFRTTYTVDKVNSEFKVKQIKSNTKL